MDAEKKIPKEERGGRLIFDPKKYIADFVYYKQQYIHLCRQALGLLIELFRSGERAVSHKTHFHLILVDTFSVTHVGAYPRPQKIYHICLKLILSRPVLLSFFLCNFSK